MRVSTAIYILNRTSSRMNSGTTPYEMWMGKKPTLSHLRIFGSEAYVYIDKQFRKKFDPKAKKMILVGYQAESTNYRLYDPISKKIVVSRNVVIHEGKKNLTNTSDESNTESLKLPEIQEIANKNDNGIENGGGEVFLDESIYTDAEDESTPVKKNEPAIQKRTLRDRATLKAPNRYEANVIEYSTPITFKEAVTGPNSDQWKEAIKRELEAHQRNNTWVVEKKKDNKTLIDSKWVFKTLKNSSDEDPHCQFKARLCARGFLQQPGLDYHETFSPVVRYDSLRVMLALVVRRDLELAQFDVQTAFLYGELEEEIWMKIPEGLELGTLSSEKDSLVCKLVKSLYGLKQSPRC